MRLTRRSAMSWVITGFVFASFGPGLAKSYAQERHTIARLHRMFGASEPCIQLARRIDLRLNTGLCHSFHNCIGVSEIDLMAMSDAAFLAAIKHSIRRDFVVGRIVSIEGWQITATELAIVKALGFTRG